MRGFQLEKEIKSKEQNRGSAYTDLSGTIGGKEAYRHTHHTPDPIDASTDFDTLDEPVLVTIVRPSTVISLLHHFFVFRSAMLVSLEQSSFKYLCHRRTRIVFRIGIYGGLYSSASFLHCMLNVTPWWVWLSGLDYCKVQVMIRVQLLQRPSVLCSSARVLSPPILNCSAVKCKLSKSSPCFIYLDRSFNYSA